MLKNPRTTKCVGGIFEEEFHEMNLLNEFTKEEKL